MILNSSRDGLGGHKEYCGEEHSPSVGWYSVAAMPHNMCYDAAATDRRFQSLRQYCEEEALIDPGEFHCCHEKECMSEVGRKPLRLVEGGLAHVGEEYDIRFGSKELRLMFVGYDYGRGCAGLVQRRHDIQNLVLPLNPHYSGITKVLIEVFQATCQGVQDEDEWRPLLKRMVQTNATRCCAPKGNEMRCNTTAEMRRLCWIHFKKEIEILEPTVIFFHGAELIHSFVTNVQTDKQLCLEPVYSDGLTETSLSREFHEHCKQITWATFPHAFESVLLFFHHPSYGHFGRQWDSVLLAVKQLRHMGRLPMLNSEWNVRKQKEWPSV